MRVLLTGADGFVGRHLASRLEAQACVVRLGRMQASTGSELAPYGVHDVAEAERWTDWPKEIDAVVHLAARVSNASNRKAVAELLRTNVEGTRAVAARARAEGVGRIVLLSTLHVHGLPTNRAHREEDPLAPRSLYAESKRQAEEAFWEALGSDRHLGTVLRSAPVFGPGGRGKLAALMKLAAMPLPLPVRELHAPRSVIAVDHLTQVIALAAQAEAAAGETFLVAGREPIHVEDIVRAVRAGLGRPARVLPSLRGLPRLPLLDALIRRSLMLVDQFDVADVSKVEARLGWRSPESTFGTVARLAAQMYRK